MVLEHVVDYTLFAFNLQTTTERFRILSQNSSFYLMKWDKKEVPRDYPKLSSKSSEMRAFGSTLGVIQLFSRL